MVWRPSHGETGLESGKASLGWGRRRMAPSLEVPELPRYLYCAQHLRAVLDARTRPDRDIMIKVLAEEMVHDAGELVNTGMHVGH